MAVQTTTLPVLFMLVAEAEAGVAVVVVVAIPVVMVMGVALATVVEEIMETAAVLEYIFLTLLKQTKSFASEQINRVMTGLI